MTASVRERVQLARDIAEQLRTLAPGDITGYRAVACQLADAGITRSMVDDLAPAGGTLRERIEYALSRTLVDMEAGPQGRKAVAGYDQELIDWHVAVLTVAGHPVVLPAE